MLLLQNTGMGAPVTSKDRMFFALGERRADIWLMTPLSQEPPMPQ